jgi:hypothetical protein
MTRAPSDARVAAFPVDVGGVAARDRVSTISTVETLVAIDLVDPRRYPEHDRSRHSR